MRRKRTFKNAQTKIGVKRCSPHSARIVDPSNLDLWVSETSSKELSSGYCGPNGVLFATATFFYFDGKFPSVKLPKSESAATNLVGSEPTRSFGRRLYSLRNFDPIRRKQVSAISFLF